MTHNRTLLVLHAPGSPVAHIHDGWTIGSRPLPLCRRPGHLRSASLTEAERHGWTCCQHCLTALTRRRTATDTVLTALAARDPQ